MNFCERGWSDRKVDSPPFPERMGGVKLQLDDITDEDTLRMWLPQAKALAEKARSGEEVMKFLISKGIDPAAAGSAAAELWQDAQSGKAWWKSPKHWIGGSMMTFGILVACFCFSFGGGVLAAIAACGLAGLGGAVLWGGFLERN